MLLEGLNLPLTTPFYPDGRLNLRKLEHNVARYSKTPVAGLAVLSGAGEPAMLSDEETRQALAAAVDAAAIEKVLLAGVSRDSVAMTLELEEDAARLGYDVALVRAPSFLRGAVSAGRVKELLVYFQTVADRSALPILLDEGSRLHGTMPDAVVAELAGHPQIIGVVDCSGEGRIARLKAGTASVRRDVTVTTVFAAVTGRMRGGQDASSTGGLIGADALKDGGTTLTVAPTASGMKTRTKAIGFQILAGATTAMLDGLRSGAAGAMPPFAAAAPQACYEVLAAWKDGDEDLAREKQVRLQHVAHRLEEELGVAGIKFACDLNGYFGGRPRLPLLPPGGEECVEMEALMQGLRN